MTNASATKVRKRNARINATAIDSTVSRIESICGCDELAFLGFSLLFSLTGVAVGLSEAPSGFSAGVLADESPLLALGWEIGSVMQALEYGDAPGLPSAGQL